MSQTFDLILRGAIAATPNGIAPADIAISGGRITAIGRGEGSAAAGALVMDLGDFGARNQVMVDHVHPTAFGQVAIAQRALAVLAADGLPARIDPEQLIAPSYSRVGAVREAEIQQDGLAVGHQAYVIRFDIAVDKAFAMQGRDRFGDLAGNPQRSCHGQTKIAPQPAAQRLTGKHFHDQEIRWF